MSPAYHLPISGEFSTPVSSHLISFTKKLLTHTFHIYFKNYTYAYLHKIYNTDMFNLSYWFLSSDI